MVPKSWMRFAALSALVLATTQVVGCAEKAHAKTDVDGQYELFSNLRPHALDVVHIDVYEDFTCPACQQFANDFMPAMQAAYGSRIKISPHYLVGPTSPVSAQVLYETADKKGQGEEAATRLFAAKLDHHDATKNEPVVEGIARDMKLAEDYRAARNDPEVERSIREKWNTDGAKITFFPSVVLEKVLLTNSNPENLNTIVNSLLRQPMVQVTVAVRPDGAVRVKTDQSDN
jgi:predicted DsbA family dithiol-disulfide isomerase